MRSELEDWARVEHRDAMANRFDVCYGLNADRKSNDGRGAVERLAEILRAGYADCSPRQKMLEHLYRALSIMDGA